MKARFQATDRSDVVANWLYYYATSLPRVLAFAVHALPQTML